MEKIHSNSEDAFSYLVDCPTEHATGIAHDLFNRFTGIPDEHDDITDDFIHMPQGITLSLQKNKSPLTQGRTTTQLHEISSFQQHTLRHR